MAIQGYRKAGTLRSEMLVGMGRFSAFCAAVLTSLLLLGCQSKRDICARYFGDQITRAKAAKTLNIKPEHHDPKSYQVDWEKVSYWDIQNFCEFYKN